MKILLYGATGRLGRRVLQTALAQGHEVHALARKAHRIAPQKGLTVFEGSVLHEATVAQAVAGCNAVISTLNISRKSDFPWAPLRAPKTLMSNAMQVLLPIAKQQGIERLAVCSAWGTFETKQALPWVFRKLIDYSNIGHGYADHERQEQVVAQGGLAYTIALPVFLTNSKAQENITTTPASGAARPGLFISRQSVAQFLVNSLSNQDLVNQRVIISKG